LREPGIFPRILLGAPQDGMRSNDENAPHVPSSEPSASKPRDSKLKREQNPRYRRHNGLRVLVRGADAGVSDDGHFGGSIVSHARQRARPTATRSPTSNSCRRRNRRHSRRHHCYTNQNRCRTRRRWPPASPRCRG
jgi:hypothetical protein